MRSHGFNNSFYTIQRTVRLFHLFLVVDTYVDTKDVCDYKRLLSQGDFSKKKKKFFIKSFIKTPLCSARLHVKLNDVVINGGNTLFQCTTYSSSTLYYVDFSFYFHFILYAHHISAFNSSYLTQQHGFDSDI